MKTFTLRNLNCNEINDQRHPDKFLLDGCAYRIQIHPKCKHWRLGLRFSFDITGSSWSLNSRYNNSEVRHLEVSVGARSASGWHSPNQIQFEQHNIPETPGIFVSSNEYVELSVVSLYIKDIGQGKLEATLSFGSFSQTIKGINIGFSKAFDIFAWADFTDFEIDCQIMPEFIHQRIELKPNKAISNQKTELTLGKLSVFFGANNSGKTSVLVGVSNAYEVLPSFSNDYLGINRVHSESVYNYALEAMDSYDRSDHQKNNRRKRLESSIGQYGLFDWMEELALQDEDTRKAILDWVECNLESWEFKELKTGKFTSGLTAMVNGKSPSEQGNGAKAVLPIVIQLYNPQVRLLAIDEPELGLEPRLQKVLFNSIKEASQGINNFPAKRILLATHSHLFLDREEIGNNFSVQKTNGLIDIEKIEDTEQLQRATYSLLGANPSDLFFPSNVVIVEGRSDEIFLNAIYRIGKTAGRFKSKGIVFHFLDGYEKVGVASKAIVQMLKTQAYTPVYRERICGLFDKPVKNSRIIDDIRAFFKDANKERFVLLEKPAIEYYYPLKVINIEFNQTVDQYSYWEEVDKFLSLASKQPPFMSQLFGQEISKVDLARRIAEKLTIGAFDDLNPLIIGLLVKADDLAYKN